MRSICVSISAFAGLLYGQAGLPSFPERAPRYHLQPSDIVEIQYRLTPEYNQTARIQPDGFVSLYAVGNVRLSDLTLDEARAEIIKGASVRLRNPEITVTLKEFDKPHFVVGGQVKNPGRFDLHADTTALEAIDLAGGFSNDSALHSEVVLFRRIAPDVGQARILNLKRFVTSHDWRENVALRPGDILFVPQNRVSKIERVFKWANLGLFFNPLTF
jgi:polysaccharide export outer membrane protein